MRMDFGIDYFSILKRLLFLTKNKQTKTNQSKTTKETNQEEQTFEQCLKSMGRISKSVS